MALINFLDVIVMKKGNQPVTDLYVTQPVTHQYIHASSCHVSHFKEINTFQSSLTY